MRSWPGIGMRVSKMCLIFSQYSIGPLELSETFDVGDLSTHPSEPTQFGLVELF